MILDHEVDSGIKDNLRMALLSKIVVPCLENATKGDVILVACKYGKSLEKIMLKPVNEDKDPEKLIMQILDLQIVLILFGLFFKKSENDGIRMSIHPAIYGSKTKRNELTKRTILICHKIKRGKLQWEDFLTEY